LNSTDTAILPPLREVWEFDASAGFGPFSAISRDSVIFAGTLQGDVIAVHAGSGKKIGSRDFGSSVTGAPSIGGDMLFVPLATGEEGIVAYDLPDGAVAWTGLTGPVETTPLVLGERVIVAALGGKVFCFNAATGTEAWRFRLPETRRPSFIRSSPAAEDSVVVFGADDGCIYGLNSENGVQRWVVRTGSVVTGTPAVSNGVVYAGSEDGCVYAIRSRSGEILWKQNLGSPIFAGAAVGSGRIFIGTSDGALVGLNRTDGAVAWRFRAKSVITATPLLSGSILYIGSLDRTLYALNAETGDSLWSSKFESRIRTTPVPVCDRLIIQLEDRTILALTHEGVAR
jgi:outer membrane protein assembly factor BamB